PAFHTGGSGTEDVGAGSGARKAFARRSTRESNTAGKPACGTAGLREINVPKGTGGTTRSGRAEKRSAGSTFATSAHTARDDFVAGNTKPIKKSGAERTKRRIAMRVRSALLTIVLTFCVARIARSSEAPVRNEQIHYAIGLSPYLSNGVKD